MSRNRNTFRHRNVLRYVTAIPTPSIQRILKSERNSAKRIREEEERQTERCELSPYGGSERSAVCIDKGVYRFRRGYGGGTSGRRRLTAIKRAIYKLNNNNTVAIAA